MDLTKVRAPLEHCRCSRACSNMFYSRASLLIRAELCSRASCTLLAFSLPRRAHSSRSHSCLFSSIELDVYRTQWTTRPLGCLASRRTHSFLSNGNSSLATRWARRPVCSALEYNICSLSIALDAPFATLLSRDIHSLTITITRTPLTRKQSRAAIDGCEKNDAARTRPSIVSTVNYVIETLTTSQLF